MMQGQVQFLGVVFQDKEREDPAVPQRTRQPPTRRLVDQGGKTAIAYGVGGVSRDLLPEQERKGSWRSFEGPIDPDTPAAERAKRR